MLNLRAVIILLHLCLAFSPFAVLQVTGVQELSRHDFPPDFIFGASSSAYQVEGAAYEDGRTPSIFDTFAHSGGSFGNGDITADEYHKYKEDVKLMVETGLDAYRFSISWSRLIPNGRGFVNLKGLEYYNNLINELISHDPSGPFGEEPAPNAPWGLQQFLEQFKQVYDNLPVFIHENGLLDNHNGSLDDQMRVEYLQGHIKATRDAIRNGSNTRGYFVWSFLDVYELLFGDTHTFGLYYVNFTDPNLTRHPKLSQKWYSGFLKAKNIATVDEVEDINASHPLNTGTSVDAQAHSSA